MPALRLKTKLVFAITAMVVAIVATLATVYISEVVHQRMQESYNDGDFIAHQIFSMARDALETDLSSTHIDLNNPKQVEDAVEEILQSDAGVNSLLEAVVGYSPTIYDAAITDIQGRALLHTNEAFSGKVLSRREDLRSIAQGDIRSQLRVIYGPSHIYDVRVPLVRNGTPFGEVRVGVSTVLLKSSLQPRLNNALFFFRRIHSGLFGAGSRTLQSGSAATGRHQPSA